MPKRMLVAIVSSTSALAPSSIVHVYCVGFRGEMPVEHGQHDQFNTVDVNRPPR